jgi:hypothetical protein
MRLTRRQRIYFWLRHKVLHRMKHSPYRPKRVIERRREHKLTLTRGYSTFVLDEFNFHFNKMAADSLRFHLSPRCIVDNEPRRELYEALIARLEEPVPKPTPHEEAATDTWKPLSEPVFNARGKAVSRRLTDCPPQAKEAFASWRVRQEDWLERIHQARRDFVEVIPELWS